MYLTAFALAGDHVVEEVEGQLSLGSTLGRNISKRHRTTAVVVSHAKQKPCERKPALIDVLRTRHIQQAARMRRSTLEDGTSTARRVHRPRRKSYCSSCCIEQTSGMATRSPRPDPGLRTALGQLSASTAHGQRVLDITPRCPR
jgi:hypothetical protein